MGTSAGSQRTPVALTLIVLILLVLAAASVGDFSADPVMDAPDTSSQRTESPAPSTTMAPAPVPDGERIVVDGGTLVAAALVLLMLALALLTRFLLRFRGRQQPDGDAPEQADLQRSAAATLVSVTLPDWATASHTTLVSGGNTSDAIIRCWLELERVCAEAGVGRSPAQTTSDFASTVAATLDLPHRPLTALNHLYQRARFGQADRNRTGDLLGPAEREAAAASVDELARSLAARARQPGVRP